MHSFKQWLIQEDGYVYFKPSIKITINGKVLDISFLDLQIQNLNKQQKPRGNISLMVDQGWLNIMLRKGSGLFFYDFESLTQTPKYAAFEGWLDNSLIIGKNNNRLDQNIDSNVAV